MGFWQLQQRTIGGREQARVRLTSTKSSALERFTLDFFNLLMNHPPSMASVRSLLRSGTRSASQASFAASAGVQHLPSLGTDDSVNLPFGVPCRKCASLERQTSQTRNWAASR